MPDFPWPPPAPSAQATLPSSLFVTAVRPAPPLSSVGAALVSALGAPGIRVQLYRAPNGFGLVARLERIAADGTPMPEEFRFLLPGSEEPFSLAAYVKRLFFAPQGLYRQIVFAVTDQPFAATGTSLTAESAARLLSKGANRLSSDFDSLPFTDGHRVTALIYEFRKGARDGDVSTLTPSRLGARTHLEKGDVSSARCAMNVFISYRRNDTQDLAGRIADRLRAVPPDPARLPGRRRDRTRHRLRRAGSTRLSPIVRSVCF